MPENLELDLILARRVNLTKLEKSPVAKRSVVVAGHKTSVSLEEPFWNAMKEIAANRQITLAVLVAQVDEERKGGNLSSAIRLFVLEYYRSASVPVLTKP